MIKGWESELPASFPLPRLHRDAVRDARDRVRRRRQRVQRAVSVGCAVALVAVIGSLVARDEPAEQIRTGPGPLASVAMANGKIAFLRSTGPLAPAEIVLMNEDGTGQTVIAATSQGHHPTWSPDGRRLAYGDVGGIYTVNADGSGEERVPTTTDDDQTPAWSPDGTRLAVRSLTGSGGIDVVNVDGSGRRRLTNQAMDGRPAWSPDGTMIAFSRNDDIHVMDADDGSSVRRLTRTLNAIEDEPSWSPDGRQIVFRQNSTISVVDVDGGEARSLISPGGTRAVDPVGRGANKLAVGRGDPSEPRWSPDGTKIVFALYQSGEACSIWVMNADGSGQAQLTDNLTCDRDPAWQPRAP